MNFKQALDVGSSKIMKVKGSMISAQARPELKRQRLVPPLICLRQFNKLIAKSLGWFIIEFIANDHCLYSGQCNLNSWSNPSSTG